MSEGRTRKAGSPRRRIAPVASGRRVLVATDFSALAARALPWAYALAGPGGAVVLVHVIESETHPNPLYAHYEPGPAASRDEREERRADVRERLRALAQVGADVAGVATELEVVENPQAADGIREAALRCRADAICLASRRRGRVGRALLGSVAEALLRDADFPLFIVPEPRD